MGVCQTKNNENIQQSKVPDQQEPIPIFDDDFDINEEEGTVQIQLDQNNQGQQNLGLTDFEFIKVIGRGSFGKVLLVRKTDTKQLFAVKILKKSMLVSQKSKDNAVQERQIMIKARSDFTVKLHYAFQSPLRLYMVMDFMQGGELFLQLRRNGRFNEEMTQFYAAELLVALNLLHEQGIVYRDLKPENILLDQGGHIVLADFGLSKLGYDKDNNIMNSFCGTPEYVAPDVLFQKGYTHVVDFYSLGALIFEMLSGEPPHFSRDKREMLKNRCQKPLELKQYFSLSAQSLLKGLLTKDPNYRLGNKGVYEIKKHSFFSGIDWNAVQNRSLVPPIIPKIRHKEDLSCFATAFTQQTTQETPIQNQLEEQYENFSYNITNQ